MPDETGASSSIDTAAQIQAQAEAEKERLRQMAQQQAQQYLGVPQAPAGQSGYPAASIPVKPTSQFPNPVQVVPPKVMPAGTPTFQGQPLPRIQGLESPARVERANQLPTWGTPAPVTNQLGFNPGRMAPPTWSAAPNSAGFNPLNMAPRELDPLRASDQLRSPYAGEFSAGFNVENAPPSYAEPDKAKGTAGGINVSQGMTPMQAANAYRAAQDPTLPQAVRDKALADYRTATKGVREQINPPTQTETMAQWKERMDTRTDYDRFLLERGVDPGKMGRTRVAAEDAAIGAAERKVDAGQELTPGEMSTLKGYQARQEKYNRVPAIGPGTVTAEAARNLNRYSAEYGQLNRELEILRQKRDTEGMKAKRAEIENLKNQTGVSRGIDSGMKNEIARLQGIREEMARVQRGGKPKEVPVEAPRAPETPAEKAMTERMEDQLLKKKIAEKEEEEKKKKQKS